MSTAERTHQLDECVDVFRQWLYMPDPSALIAAAGSIAANRIAGDPVWLLIVGPPGGGKSELIQSFSRLEHIYPASTLTEAALLSGTPKRDRDNEARGGLLRVLGDFGILVLKDFTSVLSMDRHERGRVLSALREIYDGAWTRHVGVDGGRTLHWEGRVGMLAGVTPTIDRHHGVMSAMGERFVFFRLPEVDVAEQARRAIAHAGHEIEMRLALAGAVEKLMDTSLSTPRELTGDELQRLVALSRLVVRGRSAVERDDYTREIVLLSEPEAPTRVIVVLKRLLGGMEAIGCDSDLAWQIVTKVGLDSMPQLRRALMEVLEDEADAVETGVLAEVLQYPTTTTRRGLEDLQAYQLVERASQGSGKADVWWLSDFCRDLLTELGGSLKTACDLTRFVGESGEGDKKKESTYTPQNGNGRMPTDFDGGYDPEVGF